MKIINNQDTLLLDELKGNINPFSNVYVSCNYFTAFAVLEVSYKNLHSYFKARQV